MDIKLHKKETHGTRNTLILALVLAIIFAAYKFIVKEEVES